MARIPAQYRYKINGVEQPEMECESLDFAIITALRHTIGCEARPVLITCGETNLTFQDIVMNYQNALGPYFFIKPCFLCADTQCHDNVPE
jgi:hypothetical protein